MMIFSVLATFALAAADPAAVAAPEKKDPTVCKRTAVGSTGSRLRTTRVCMKASEWAELQQNTDRAGQKLNDKGGGVGQPAQGTGVSAN